MAKPLLDDALWGRIRPLLPPHKPRRFRFPGRKPLGDRKVLTGILFVLTTGIPWEDLFQEMGCGMTCLNRLKRWHQAGVWQRLHQLLLSGEKTGPNPTDRGEPGSKHHVVTDGHGIPLAASLTGANTNEVTRAPHGSGLGVARWVVERTVSWLHGFRRLRLRTDWRGEIQEAFLALACCVICFRFV
jgi:transposase